MTDKERAVIEAARNCVIFLPDDHPLRTNADDLSLLTDALQALDAEQESAWITDAPPNGCTGHFMAYKSNGSIFKAHSDVISGCWGNTIIAWQPVPQCLRTPPAEPKCETCNHYEHGLCWEPRDYAWKNPCYGMDGCNFKRKGGDNE